MSKVQRLEKAQSALEKKSQLTKREKQHAEQSLASLNSQKELLNDARKSCDSRPGEKLSSLSCWGRNQFVELLADVSVLLEEKIKAESGNLEQINQRLEEERRMTSGVEHLKNKETEKQQQKQLRDELQETDRLLQRTPR
ncbi:hypothetical protein [Endozoicomonas sp. 8E]|uniref:hypothetical protein n=1 Tax=Endozoicomonas sp. 8E TaxID=3035692 RepID=UPI002938F5FD|nr:hypothetical protein [Endozoicomonas sp. 8E]WOG29086.1 hypothetical protein P6910_05320 [Endozoicomonas sp. 8E]